MGKTPLLLGFVFYLLYHLTAYLTGEPMYALAVFIIPFGALILNFFLRKKLRYAPWFTSGMNLLVAKDKRVTVSTISADLLYDKFLELIEESDFHLLDTDAENHHILCGTSINFLSWGENVYIRFREDSSGNSEIHYASVSMLGTDPIRRTSRNNSSIIASFEASLTV